jgi:hypothetical protein
MPRRNRRSHSARKQAVGTPPPSLPCPHCPRHFYSKTGRTRHIHAKHSEVVDVNVLEVQDRNTPSPLLLSGESSGSRHSHQSQDDEQSPVLSDSQGRNPSPPLLRPGESSGSLRSHQSQDDEQSPILSDSNPSPIPFDHMPSPIPSLDHDVDMVIDSPHADRDHTPTESNFNLSESSSSAENRSRQATNPPEIERIYHPIMNGMWYALSPSYHRLKISAC